MLYKVTFDTKIYFVRANSFVEAFRMAQDIHNDIDYSCYALVELVTEIEPVCQTVWNN